MLHQGRLVEDVDPQAMRESLEQKAEALHAAGEEIPAELLMALPDIPCPPSPPAGANSPPRLHRPVSPDRSGSPAGSYGSSIRSVSPNDPASRRADLSSGI